MVNKLENIKEVEIAQGFKGKFLHSNSFTIAYWEISKDAILKEHKHIHEQITHVTEGILELTVNNTTHILEAGSVVIIPPNIPHSGKAITNCKVTDTFCPVREDFK